MSHIIAAPFGIGLPYTSIFTVSRREQSKGRATRSPQYFWNKAIAAANPDLELDQGLGTNGLGLIRPDPNWLDVDTPALSESDDDQSPQRPPPNSKPKKSKSFARLRQIAFRSFIPSPGSNKNGTIVATEVISQEHGQPQGTKKGLGKNLAIFNSWKIKSKGTKTEVKKMVAVLRTRISKSSPSEVHPKTWDEYHQLYASQQIDILNPPLPPTDPAAEGEAPTAYHARAYYPPRPANEAARQLVVNRLGFFGKRNFDPSEQAAARSRERTELGDQLMEQGQAPESLEKAWERRSISSEGDHFGVAETQAMMDGVRRGELPPETLEQHPVFRKIVKQCREMFGTSISMLTIMDEDRQIFLAESGLGGMREVSRDVTFCAHTILSGRKGFTILDTHNDWRFENGPLVQKYGSRFYAGVPLMAPNFDGSADDEENITPLGTLCVVDDKPREEFGVEDRKKLVYMAEYARREIEKWFLKKMEQKMKALEASQEVWHEEVKRVTSTQSGEGEVVSEEVLSDLPSPTELDGPSSTGHAGLKKRSSFARFKSTPSNASTPPTSPSSQGSLPLKSPLSAAGPSLFDDVTKVVKPKMQKVFDLATKLVGDTLDLSLVYLLAVAPQGDSEQLGRTMIISGHNIPLPVPIFDAGLHLRALRAPEGGLLYQNPSTKEADEAALQPKMSSGSDTSHQLPKANPYASAMLVSVGSESHPNAGGFVLAGFTGDSKRVFGGEDVSYMKQFAHELEKYTAKLRL